MTFNWRSLLTEPSTWRGLVWLLPAAGLPDFLTVKRFYAYTGRDPGEDAPPVLACSELSRVDGRPVWTPRQIDHDSGVGTQFEVVDMNADGLLDIVIANKKGVFYFEQHRDR